MKSNKLILFLAGICLALTSCNDFLDRLPDDRAELNSLDKVAKFLSSAYGTHSLMLLCTNMLQTTLLLMASPTIHSLTKSKCTCGKM